MNGSTVNFQSVFTSEFDNYKVIFTNGKLPSSAAIRMQLMSGSTPEGTAGSYVYGGFASTFASSSLAAIFSGSSSANTFLGVWTLDGRFTHLELTTPNVANTTGITVNNFGGSETFSHNGLHTIASAYDGFRIFADGGGTITGTARIYGYRNA
jgi:hypothetical protein